MNLECKIKGYPFEVRIEGNSAISGVALAGQIKNLDWRARGVKYVAAADISVFEEGVAKFEALLHPE